MSRVSKPRMVGEWIELLKFWWLYDISYHQLIAG
jgi:hypothetical protein